MIIVLTLYQEICQYVTDFWTQFYNSICLPKNLLTKRINFMEIYHVHSNSICLFFITHTAFPAVCASWNIHQISWNITLWCNLIWIICYIYFSIISKFLCKPAITPVYQQWSYHSPALIYHCAESESMVAYQTNSVTLTILFQFLRLVCDNLHVIFNILWQLCSN